MTTSKHTVAELRELLAKASGPDRKLDAAITRLIDLPKCHEPDCLPDVLVRILDRVEAGGDDFEVPAYTASIDAALTLVPEGLERLPLSFKVERFYLGNGVWKSRASVWDGLGGVSSLDTASEAATPALALCAAALRARTALQSGEPK